MAYNYQKKVKDIEAICKKWNLTEKKEHVYIIDASKVKSYKDRTYEFDFRANNLKTYIKVNGRPKFKFNSISIKDLNLETFEAFIEKRITNYQ
jgi:hypothetical protein